MSIGSRLREERLRLGLNQTDLAGHAGASKGAQINWEKDTNSPPASALAAYADLGIDVLYVLTGQRTFQLPIDVVPYVEAQLANIRRELLKHGYQRLPGEDAEHAEKRWLNWHANTLSSILNEGFQLAPPELKEEAARLLDVVTNPAALALFRAGEYASERAKARAVRKEMLSYLDDGSYIPGAAVTHLLVELAVDFDIPVKRLADLLHEMHDEAQYRAEEEGDAGPPSALK